MPAPTIRTFIVVSLLVTAPMSAVDCLSFDWLYQKMGAKTSVKATSIVYFRRLLG